MSRGGRGGGRGGGRRGPDLSWDDEEVPSTPTPNKPEELFPYIHLPIPKPLSQTELGSVQRYLRFREQTRNGPLYAVLDSSSFTDNKGKVDKRAAFDPFTDQEKYSAKYHKRKRTVPELRGRNYALKYFPHELWSTLDPKREHPLWKTVEPESGTTARLRKRKRALLLEDEDDVPESQTAVAGAAAASGLAASQSDNDSDSDALVTSGRRKQRDLTRPRRGNPTTNAAKQKQGLDAEDDYPDVEPNENDDDGAGGGDDEPVDSEFSESDDGDGDDYNAENYFDPGEGDDDDGGGGGGGDDDGGYY